MDVEIKDILLAVGITVFIAVCVFGLVFVIVLSIPDSSLDDEKTFVIIDSGNINGIESFRIYEDTTTGVQYVFIDYGQSGGLSPRYNADGMIYVNKSPEVSV